MPEGCDVNINCMHNLWPVHTYVVSVLWMILQTLTIVVASPHKQVLLPSVRDSMKLVILPPMPFLTEWVSDPGSTVHFSFSSTSFCSWDWALLQYDALLYVSSTRCSKRLQSLPEDEDIFILPGAWDHLSVTCHPVSDNKSSPTLFPCGNLKFHRFCFPNPSTVEFYNLFCHLMQEQPVFETSGYCTLQSAVKKAFIWYCEKSLHSPQSGLKL